ncbi:glutathione S-transferase [Kordiimonas sediminis]|uniref:Glutathione S-transferase n=1 Tax=Kordiimonas sediminis TaxID=1735581 RepID=A0A919AIS9_9PROT|nr:glutathione S-transferase N-terminal domain-containing protein [Kordiimonas sediminis]GHF10751.1 glutathione S-transferase [Kordiimonas sediminis]
MIQLYELCGKDRDTVFSPFAWRVHLFLQHKGLSYTSVPTRFLEKEKYAPSGSKTVPVLKDGDTWVADSFVIAHYLDDTYPEAPLFDSASSRAQAYFLNDWIARTVVRPLFPMIVVDIVQEQTEDCADYFRLSREKFLGCTLEDAQATRPEALPVFRQSLQPLRKALADNAFLCGPTPAWFDYAVFGTLMWPQVISDIKLFEEDDILNSWFGRMMDLFDGYCRKAKTVHRSG